MEPLWSLYGASMEPLWSFFGAHRNPVAIKNQRSPLVSAILWIENLHRSDMQNQYTRQRQGMQHAATCMLEDHTEELRQF